MKSLFYSLSLALLIFVAPSAEASIIGWGLPQTTLAPSDVSTNGTLVRAFNGGTVDTTVNGVNFVKTDDPSINQTLLGFGAGSFLGGGTTGDAAFDQLLNQAAFSFNTGNSDTIDLGIFTPGSSYEVQVFYTDQRTNANQTNPPINDRITTFGSVDGINIAPTVNLEADPDNLVNSEFGQFAIGTFVADGNDPDLTIFGANYAGTQINAFQIRELANVVPEVQGTVLLTMLIGIGSVLVKRRRA